MLRTLVLIVFSVAFLGAKEFPIERKMNIYISNKTTTVLEFPFKIEDKRADAFKLIKYVDKKEREVSPELDIPKTTIKRTKVVNGKKIVISEPVRKKTSNKKSPIKINSSKDGNIIELKPEKTGSLKLIVWGYKYYPIMLTINILEDDAVTSDYFSFKDYITPKKEVVKFESQKHEKVLVELLRKAYLEEKIKGYTTEIYNKTVEENLNYELKLVNEKLGKKYKVISYLFKNRKNTYMELKNEMFAKANTFAVSIENLSKKLKPNEATRVFIVEKR